MKMFLTLGVESAELNLELRDEAVDCEGLKVLLEDREEDGNCTMINKIVLVDRFDTFDEGQTLDAVATVDRDKGFVSLHLLDGEMLYTPTLKGIFAALKSVALT